MHGEHSQPCVNVTVYVCEGPSNSSPVIFHAMFLHQHTTGYMLPPSTSPAWLGMLRTGRAPRM